jgi:hypothetical protein
MASVIRDLNEAAGSSENHANFYKSVWPDLSAFLHTYEVQLRPWLAGTDIESSHSEEQLSSLVTLASKTMRLAEYGVLSLAADAV